MNDYILYATGPRFLVIRRLAEGEAVSIGRSRSADVMLHDPLVSRIHAWVSAGSDETIRIKDCGSLNGTCIDDEKIAPTAEVQLPLGHALRLGSTTVVVERSI